LILLDAMMPGMDGFAVAEQIRQQPDLAGAAVMMLTSADGQGDAVRCRALGLTAYLVKPVKAYDLQRSIAAALTKDQIDAQTVRVVKPVFETAGRPLRILLAEDNAVNQRVAVRLLEKDGHCVVVANHGGEAVAALHHDAFDLVLMDLQMPHLDGFEATRRIRENEMASGRHTPIVAMTAHAMTGDRERCLAAGMDDYLSKPVQRAELQRVLGTVASGMAAPSTEEIVAAETVCIFDRAAALQRLGGDEELLAEISGLFRADGVRLLEEIRTAVADGDAAAVQRAAHGLKGAAGYIGAAPVVDAAEHLETLGAGGNVNDAVQALHVLETELGRLTAALAV